MTVTVIVIVIVARGRRRGSLGGKVAVWVWSDRTRRGGKGSRGRRLLLLLVLLLEMVEGLRGVTAVGRVDGGEDGLGKGRRGGEDDRVEDVRASKVSKMRSRASCADDRRNWMMSPLSSVCPR